MCNSDKSVEKHLDDLRNRVKRCICSYCGGELELREIVYSNCKTARTEIFCSECNRMNWGSEPEIYAIGKSYMHESKFYIYKDMAASTLKDEMNRARLNEFLTWSLETLGFLDENGFTRRVSFNDATVASMFTWKRSEVDDLSDKA